MRRTLICVVYLIMILVSVMPVWAESEEFTYETIHPNSYLDLAFDVDAGVEIRFNLSFIYNFNESWHGNGSRIEFWWEDPQGEIINHVKIDDDSNWNEPNEHNEIGLIIITKTGTWKYVCKNNDRQEAITLGYFFRVTKSDNSNLLPNVIIIGGIVTVSCLGLSAGLISTREPLKHSFFIGLAPLYTKIKKNEVLNQFNRGQIFQYITDNPGVHYNRIKSHLNLKNGVLAYHLKVLEEQEYIKSRKDGKLKRFYDMKYTVSQNMAHLNEFQRKIMRMILNNPEINQIDLAKATGSSPALVSYNMNQLKKKGFVKVIYTGREVHYHLVEGLDLTKFNKKRN